MEANQWCGQVRIADIICLSAKQKTYVFFFPSASSFYPGYGGHATTFNPEPRPLPPRDDDFHEETEEWSDEEDIAEVTQGQLGKIDEVVANEVRLMPLKLSNLTVIFAETVLGGFSYHCWSYHISEQDIQYPDPDQP